MTGSNTKYVRSTGLSDGNGYNVKIMRIFYLFRGGD